MAIRRSLLLAGCVALLAAAPPSVTTAPLQVRGALAQTPGTPAGRQVSTAALTVKGALQGQGQTARTPAAVTTAGLVVKGALHQ